VSATYRQSLFEIHLKKQAHELDIPTNLPPPELRVQIRDRLQFRLKQLSLPHEGTNSELRQRLRDGELAQTGNHRVSDTNSPLSAKELREKGVLELDGTEDWTALRQKVLGYYNDELIKRGKVPRGNLHDRKARLQFLVDGTRVAKKEDVQKKKKVVKKKTKAAPAKKK
jgi:hypothetical protein